MIVAERQRVSAGPRGSSASSGRRRSRRSCQLDHEIDDSVRGSPAWREKEDLLASVPSVGPIIARTISPNCPSSARSTTAIAALVGLAPFTRQSGHWQGKTFIGGGRSNVRAVLFMPPAAARHNPRPGLPTAAHRAGKPKMVAIVAVARKLLTILNAILRHHKLMNLVDAQHSR